MSITKLKTLRPEITINKASELLQCEPDDLVFLAGIGEITLYVVAGLWEINSIVQIDPSVRIDELLKMHNSNTINIPKNSVKKSPVFIAKPAHTDSTEQGKIVPVLIKAIAAPIYTPFSMLRELYSSSKDTQNNSVEDYKKWLKEQDFSKDFKQSNNVISTDISEKETVTPNHTPCEPVENLTELNEPVANKNIINIKNNPQLSGLYNSILSGLQPVAAISSFAYINGYELMPLLLQVNKAASIPELPNLHIALKPKVIFKELLNKNKLCVMRADIQKLLSEDQSTESKPNLNKRGPLESTAERRALWQAKADELFKTYPNRSKDFIAEKILVILEKEGARHLPSVSTLRQAIKNPYKAPQKRKQ